MRNGTTTKLFAISLTGICLFPAPDKFSDGSSVLPNAQGAKVEFVVGDFNGDKLPDILTYKRTPNALEVRLFKNFGDRFEECSRRVGLPLSFAVPVQDVAFKKLRNAAGEAIVLSSKDRPERVYQYRESSEDLEDISNQLPAEARLSWCDYDGNGLPDLSAKTATEIRFYPNSGSEKSLFGEVVHIPANFESEVFGLNGGSSAMGESKELGGKSADSNATGADSMNGGDQGGSSLLMGGAEDPSGSFAGGATTGGTANPILLNCVNTIKDQATNDCLNASTTPTIGMLYPLSSKFSVAPNGSVGIGTATPDALRALHVYRPTGDTRVRIETDSTTAASVLEMEAGNAAWHLYTWPQDNDLHFFNYSGTPSDRVVFTDEGKVGIGSNPKEKFQVGSQMVLHDGGFKGLVFNGYYNSTPAGWRRQVAGYSISEMFDTAAGALRFSTAPNGAADSDAVMTERLTLLNNGNVGIGSTTPLSRLHVRSDAPNIGGSGAGGIALTGSSWQGLAMNGTASTKTMLMHFGGDATNELHFGRYGDDLGAWEANPFTFDMDAPSDSLWLTQSGYLALGSSIANARLHVKSDTANIGSTGAGGIALSGAAWQGLALDGNGSTKTCVIHYGGDANNELRFGRYGDNFGGWESNPFTFDMDAPSGSFVVTGTGSIGMGTYSPATKLQVVGGKLRVNAGLWSDGGDNTKGQLDVESTDHAYLSLRSIGTDPGFQPGMLFSRQRNTGMANGETHHTVANIDKNILALGFDGWNAPLMVYNSGNVGIGTGNGANPTAKLTVVGTTRTSVLEITGGSDLAESFDVSSDKVEPGMVMAIDPENPGKLRLATSEYDTTVAGVISGAGGVNVGMKLSQEGTLDGSHPVALTGRVYCWADASKGEIKPGDLLTSSATPGHAMKASDRSQAAGAILGKALTPLKEGKGLVLIVVSLQ